jgi:DNA invertase Pin-like site-specific DNA recombinase
MHTPKVSTGAASAYVRVSSRGQDFAMQKSAIEAALPKETEPAWYSEKLSAKKNDRPELLRLVADLRMGGTSDLWVFKLDRLCRTGVSDTFRLISELRAAKVTLHAVADGLVIRPDREDIASECYVFALGLAARLERAAINDRIAGARAHMEANGRSWGRPSRVDAELLAKARKMRIEGRSIRAIAVALKIPKSTVAGALAASEKHAPKSTPKSERDMGVQQGVDG